MRAQAQERAHEDRLTELTQAQARIVVQQIFRQQTKKKNYASLFHHRVPQTLERELSTVKAQLDELQHENAGMRHKTTAKQQASSQRRAAIAARTRTAPTAPAAATTASRPRRALSNDTATAARTRRGASRRTQRLARPKSPSQVGRRDRPTRD